MTPLKRRKIWATTILERDWVEEVVDGGGPGAATGEPTPLDCDSEGEPRASFAIPPPPLPLLLLPPPPCDPIAAGKAAAVEARGVLADGVRARAREEESSAAADDGGGACCCCDAEDGGAGEKVADDGLPEWRLELGLSADDVESVKPRRALD